MWRLQFLDSKDIQNIHQTSLKILSEVGVRVYHAEILKLLADAKAEVDFEKRVVKLSENLIMDSIKKAGKKYILYGRDHDKKARFGYGDSVFLSTASQYALIDPIKRIRFTPTIEDAREGINLVDGLEYIDIVGAYASAAEIPGQLRDVVLYAELIKNTTKPCYTWLHNKISAKYVIEMFKVLAGGEKQLKEKPMVMGIVEPASTLQFGKNALDVIIEFSKLGLPVGIGPLPIVGATAPATLAGAIALGNAEFLTGLVISQLLSPGISVLYWGIPHIMDMPTGNVASGSPEQGLMAVAVTQMAKFYGLPVGTDAGLTDSILPDAQAGLEKGMSLIIAALAGADMYGHQGILGKDQGGSLAQLVIDNEMAGYLKRVKKGFEVNEETLAFDVIKKVGFSGNFLMEEHTLNHYKKELWFPKLFERLNWEPWQKKGSKSMVEKAEERAREIISQYKEKPLESRVKREIEVILEASKKELLAYESSDRI